MATEIIVVKIVIVINKKLTTTLTKEFLCYIQTCKAKNVVLV